MWNRLFQEGPGEDTDRSGAIFNMARILAAANLHEEDALDILADFDAAHLGKVTDRRDPRAYYRRALDRATDEDGLDCFLLAKSYGLGPRCSACEQWSTGTAVSK
ncbi:MAG: hypothetical protein AAF627_09890 [Myxococcota bacterium]